MSGHIVVTTHALLQWRQRAAVHGDEGPKHVLAALRDAVRVRWSVVSDRKPHIRCYWHEALDVVFVCEEKPGEFKKVVTVRPGTSKSKTLPPEPAPKKPVTNTITKWVVWTRKPGEPWRMMTSGIKKRRFYEAEAKAARRAGLEAQVLPEGQMPEEGAA